MTSNPNLLRPDRRRLLAGGAGLVAASSFGIAGLAQAAVNLGGYAFGLGVAAGDPLPDGFVIWTRLAPKPLEEHTGMPMRRVPVLWEVAEDDRFERIVRTGEVVAYPELGHSLHVEVEGLAAHRPYFYRFRLPGGDASPVGMARTAPLAGARVDGVRLGVAGCQHYQGGLYTAFRHLSQEADLDAIFHYGDYIYEGGVAASAPTVLDAQGNRINRAHVGGEIYSLDDYRRRYAQYKSDADLQAAHASAAFITSFDDHEVDNNWADTFDQDGTDPAVFIHRRRAAMQAWYENMPVRRAQRPDARGALTMYRRLDYGSLMRMHVLDTRSYRTDQYCERAGQAHCRTDDGTGSTMLGQAQEAWLDQGLDNGARWNLIAQQVFVMPVLRKAADGTVTRGGTDTWGGYPDARQRLVKSITDKGLTNVVVATGDAHIHAVGHVPLRDDELDGPAAAVEFLTTSIASGGDGAPETEGTRAMMAGSPHMKLVNAQRGYQVFDIREREWRTDLKVVDRITSPGGRLSTLATYHVEPHRPALA